LLLLSPSCPHCPAMLQILGELIKDGTLGRLEAVNVAAHPEVAAEYGVRSVPWLRLGPFELAGMRARDELAYWAKLAATGGGMSDYFHVQLKEGGLAQVRTAIEKQPSLLAELLPIVANPEASINVRIGASVIFEGLVGSPALQALLPRLIELAGHADSRVRADACFYLGLSGAAEARGALTAALGDSNAEVREIAGEALEALG